MTNTKSPKTKTKTSSKDDFIFEEKVTQRHEIIDYLSPNEIRDLFGTVNKMALTGDWPALKFVLERMETLRFPYNLPKISTLEDAEEALSKIIDDMSKGIISSQEAKNACEVIKSLSGLKESRMLDERSRELTSKLPFKALKI